MCVSLYFEVLSSVLPQSFYGLLCSPDRPVIELIPVRILILLNFCVKTGEFEVKICAHVSGFEYPLSLLPVCYHGTGRIILASTVTSRAQACQITVTGGLPLHLAISSSRKHLFFFAVAIILQHSS